MQNFVEKNENASLKPADSTADNSFSFFFPFKKQRCPAEFVYIT